MQEIPLVKPIRDPQKQLMRPNTFPALIQLKVISPKPNIQFKFKEFDTQPETYTIARYAFSIRGTLEEYVYVLFELQFKGDKKRRYYKITLGTFQQCFDEYMEKQNATTAFANVVTKDECHANMRAQALSEFLITRDPYSVDDSLRGPLDQFGLDVYTIMIEPELNRSCKRRQWRDPRRGGQKGLHPTPRL